MSSRKLAIVTGASSGIGLEIAKLAAQDGYDIIVAADTPFVEAGPRSSRSSESRCSRSRATSRPAGAGSAAVGRERTPSRCPGGKRGPRSWACVPRPEPEGMAARHQHQHHRHAATGPADRSAHGGARRGQGAYHRVHRRPSRGIVPGSLQRLEGVHRQLLSGSERRTPRHRRHGHLPQARRDGNRVLPSRRARDTKVGQAEKDDPADVAKSGWDAMKRGRPSVIYGLGTRCRSRPRA